MGLILGVDVGGSTTKIVGFDERRSIIGELQARATDQVTSMYGAIGKFSHEYNAALGEVDKIILTGVGASFFNGDVYGIPTVKVDEFMAIGCGGLYQAGVEEA